MKKIFVKIVLVSMMIVSSSVNADAQGLLGKIADVAQKATAGNSALSSITNVITSKLVPSEDQIVGTWVYQSPAVVFETENALTNVGGAAASKSIENKLQTYLAKFGIKQGKMSITFNSDKTFTVNYGSKKISGTYTIADNKVSLTSKGRTNPCKVTPQLNNGTLVIAADATKLKDFVGGLTGSSTNATLSTISSLLKSCKGMQLGVRMTKK